MARLKQNLTWEAVTDTALDAIAADTVTVYNLLIGTTAFPANESIDEGTIRRILLYLTVLQGATAGIFHAGVMVQDNEGSAIDPRVSAEDDRWMWWWTSYQGAGVYWQPNDFLSAPQSIRVMRKLHRSQVLRFYYVNTEASSILVQTRALFGAGLKRGR